MNLYENGIYNVARTCLVMIQPLKGGFVFLDTVVEEAYRELIDASKQFINTAKGLSDTERSTYRSILEKEIEKIKNWDVELLGSYERQKTTAGTQVVSKGLPDSR